ncbi:hypothetical protein HPB49_001816 [Dermacentor silvarum]|uniref:Uncharacterized protein n=1 Tax=Dermacentor silvarum TaxID=543639 RepID=A0ACB8CCR3_DERSI|nr:hypothetical protein HPB49_001816 [Dermacentor silvarum]
MTARLAACIATHSRITQTDRTLSSEVIARTARADGPVRLLPRRASAAGMAVCHAEGARRYMDILHHGSGRPPHGNATAGHESPECRRVNLEHMGEVARPFFERCTYRTRGRVYR